MKKLGLKLDSDIKSLIISGDIEMLAELIKDFREFEINKLSN